MQYRRVFICRAAAMAAGAAWGRSAMADWPMLAENEASAVALGYRADASQVDRKQYPGYAPGDCCSGCTIYETQVGESSGLCPAFPNRRVAAGGWCRAFSVAI